MRSIFEEDKQEVDHALQRLAMLQFFFADNQPSLSQQITSDLLTVKVFLDTYYDKRGDE